MIDDRMNLLAIIIIVLALAAAGAVIYAAWELSSDKPTQGKTGAGQGSNPDDISESGDNRPER